MRIESFHIKGYKSLADVRVEGLSDINVFYGLNNVGKSNIFQALELWSKFAKFPKENLDKELSSFKFKLGGTSSIHLSGEVVFEQSDIASVNILIEKASYDIRQDIKNNEAILESLNKIISQTSIGLHQRSGVFTRAQTNGSDLNLKDQTVSYLFPNFHNIQANRRAHIEHSEKNGATLDLVTDQNIKRALFYAYLSRDLQQKRRLEAIKRLLAKPPFTLGELDVALDPESDQIDIGFVREDGRMPLENMGSGVQQLLLVLGQIFLNDHPIIAIEEPEMNLSPQYQQYLLVALRELMQDPDVRLNQLFISTHSPYFEFAETFFDVTMDEAGATHVEKLPIEKRDHYFPSTVVGPETGSRLNSAKQITLYDGVIEDLGLERGDLVLFVKNEAGHWELRPEKEITQDLEAIFGNEQP